MAGESLPPVVEIPPIPPKPIDPTPPRKPRPPVPPEPEDGPPYFVDAAGVDEPFARLAPAPGWTPPPPQPPSPPLQIAALRQRMRRCYENMLKSPPVSGRIELAVTFLGGRVVAVDVTADPGLESVAACLARVVRTLPVNAQDELRIVIPIQLAPP